MIPPITAMASGCSIWEPAPKASDSGIIPATVAIAVIRMGRRRRSPASIMASRAEYPSGAEALICIEQENAILRDDSDDHDEAHERRNIERRAGDQQRKEHA